MNLIKTIMSKLAVRRFVPDEEGALRGERPLEQIEIIEALKQYKKQNPTKWEAKKASLFKQYNLTLEDEPILEDVPDESDIELEKLAQKATKTKKTK